MMSLERRFAVQDLLASAAGALDRFRLADWIALFADECEYSIVPRDNFDAGHAVTLMLCENRGMLLDRIVAVEEANEYNIHIDKHVVGLPRIVGGSGDEWEVESDYVLFQIDAEGEASLFSVGTYLDRIVFTGETPRIRKRTVVMDNWCVPRAITTPI